MNWGGELIVMAFNEVDTIFDTLTVVVLDPVICALTECGVATINVTQSLLDFGIPQDVRAQVNITLSGIIPDGDVYRFFAGDNIVLSPGIEVELGAILEVDIENCFPLGLAEGINERLNSSDTKEKIELLRQLEILKKDMLRN